MRAPEEQKSGYVFTFAPWGCGSLNDSFTVEEVLDVNANYTIHYRSVRCLFRK